MSEQEVAKYSRSNGDNVYGSEEDWITKRRVETKTTKSIERKVQRNVVLEDGRVIEEDDPEVTLDTIEDTHTNEVESDENIDKTPLDFSIAPRSWNNQGDKILSEKRQQNILSTDLDEKRTMVSSGYNIGNLSADDVEKVITKGRSVKSLIRRSDDDEEKQMALPGHVIHRSSNHRKNVDKERIHEINRMSDGKIKTDRHVTRELIEDKENDTPEAGDSTEETESRDGDIQHYSRRKEDRFIDYYLVPKGKPISHGKKIGRGIHMTSSDTDKYNNRPAVATYRHDRHRSPSSKRMGSSPSRSRSMSHSSSRDDTHMHHPYPSSSISNNNKERLKRSMSFSNKQSFSPNLQKTSFFGSMKNIYNSLTKNKKKNHHRVLEANKVWFDNGQEPPQRPPRRYGSKQTLNEQSRRDHHFTQRQREPTSSNTLQQHSSHRSSRAKSLASDRHPPGSVHATQQIQYASSTLGRMPKSYKRSPAPTEPPPPRPGTVKSSLKKPEKKSNGVERRRTFTAYDGNRDLPHFEPERHRNSRYFGQMDDDDDGDDDDVRVRPPPNMRRLLLNGINESRRKSLSNEISSKPSKTTIRAI